ncbi:MAG: hypothetical protein EOR48_08060 [Mesorhizobium sp.]|nr:MAG: hypothetical protein EOR48_08060 [Mesorhizobium sp.]TIP48929.1 MAG: hypothetical protein E5X62_00775 [Mesorhizobium sp.]
MTPTGQRYLREAFFSSPCSFPNENHPPRRQHNVRRCQNDPWDCDACLAIRPPLSSMTDDYVREANRKRMAVDMARAIDQRKEKRD